MSELDEIELDVTKIHNGAFSLKSLRSLKKKYERYPDLVKEIEKQIKEKEDECSR